MALNSADLEDFFKSNRIVALDTSPLIYWLERNLTYFSVSNRVFELIEERRVRAVASTLTLTEVLIQPYRVRDWRRVDRAFAALNTYPHLEWIAPTLEIADRAARIRAEHNLKTPDAIQAATAILSNATGFISNDPIFRRLPVASLNVLILDEML